MGLDEGIQDRVFIKTANSHLRHHLTHDSPGASWQAGHGQLHHDVQRVGSRAAGDQEQTRLGVVRK